jgi:hypothetical protein
MAEWIGVRELERRRGVSRGSVRIAVMAGRIPESCIRRGADGSIEAVEYESATAAWNANTDVDQAARTPGGAATVVGAEGQLPLESPAAAAPSAPAAQGTRGTTELRVASAEGKQLQNKLLELELLEQIGTLVSREEVREIAARRYRAIREQILTVPDRVADILAAERDPARVHAELTKELEQVLHGLADDAVAGAAAVAPREAAERVAA